MTDADFLSTGYYGLQTGILGITAVFTLVFAYLGGLRLFLSKEPLRFKIAIYIVFLGAFVFLHLFLYSASLFGQEWLDLQSAQADQDDGFYAENSVLIMQSVWGVVALSTLVFVSLETFRSTD